MRSYGLSLTEKGIQAQKEHIEHENQVFGKILETLEAEAEDRIEFLSLVRAKSIMYRQIKSCAEAGLRRKRTEGALIRRNY